MMGSAAGTRERGTFGRGPDRAELLLIAGFWTFAFVLTSVRGRFAGEMAFELIAPHRLALMLFSALLCCLMVQVLHATVSRRFAERALVGLAGALVMAVAQAAFHWVSCRLAPIGGIPPISLPETVTSGTISLVYFMAWLGMHLALVYHRQVEAERARRKSLAEQQAPAPAAAEGPCFWVARRRQLVRIRTQDIVWIEAQKDYVALHAADGGGMLRETMAAVEARLGADQFVRVHRSAIVRRTEIATVRRKPSGALAMTLRNGDEVPVGRSYAKGLRALVEQLSAGA